MKKFFAIVFLLCVAAVSAFAAPATKNIRILIDTGKSMRNDGVSKNIYRTVGSYVANFVDARHNDKFGRNVNIVIEGVVKHKNGPLLLTVPYVNRKPGSRLDLAAIQDMSPNPPDWMTSWDLDNNPTDLDLFQTHFFEKASDTVFVVISNSDVNKKSFFGKKRSVLLEPQALNIHKAYYPGNVKVFFVSIPGTGTSGEYIFKSQTVRERVNAGMNAAWKATVFESPKASLTFDFLKDRKVCNSYTLVQDAVDAPVFGVYAPVSVVLKASNAVAVEGLKVSGSDGIAGGRFEFSEFQSKYTENIAHLKQQGSYTINAEVIGKNGDSYTRSFRFTVFNPFVFDVRANNIAVPAERLMLKGKAPFTVNFTANISNAGGQPLWFKNGKKFNPYTDNTFNSDAIVECRVKGLDGKIYSKFFDIKILSKSFNFVAKANSVELAPQGRYRKISGEKPFIVKFSSNSAKNVTWFRNGKKFIPGNGDVSFERSEEVKCIYADKNAKVELNINVEVRIPKPKAPVINVTANGVMLANSRNEAKLILEGGKKIDFEFVTKDNVSNIRYFRNGSFFRPTDPINANCEIEVRAYNSAGTSTSRYISVELPLKLARLTARSGSLERNGEFLGTIRTKSDEVEVTFGLDTSLQLDELQKYQIAYDNDSKKVPLNAYSWKKSFPSKQSHLVQLFYNGKVCDKFTIRIDKLSSEGEVAKLVANADGAKIFNGQLKVRTNAKEVVVKFAFDRELQAEDIKSRYSISYGDGSAQALDANSWQHTFAADHSYQVKLFRNGKECDKFTLTVTREYVLTFDACIPADDKQATVNEDGTISLAFVVGGTVRFTVRGIKPGTNLDDLKFQIVDSGESSVLNTTLAALKKEKEDELQKEDAEENPAPRKAEDPSVFTWSKSDFGIGTYTVKLKNENGKFEKVLHISVTEGMTDDDDSWKYILIGLVVLGGVVFCFIKRTNIVISVREGEGKAVEKKFAKCTLVLDQKFNVAPELKIQIEDSKIVIYEQADTSVECGIGKEPPTKLFFDNRKATAKFSKGQNKAVTLVVEQNGTIYNITISKK